MTSGPNNPTRPSGLPPVPVMPQPSVKPSVPQQAALPSDLPGTSYRRFKQAFVSGNRLTLPLAIAGLVLAGLGLILGIVALSSAGHSGDQEKIAMLQTSVAGDSTALTKEVQARGTEDTFLFNMIAQLNDQTRQQNINPTEPVVAISLPTQIVPTATNSPTPTPTDTPTATPVSVTETNVLVSTNTTIPSAVTQEVNNQLNGGGVDAIIQPASGNSSLATATNLPTPTPTDTPTATSTPTDTATPTPSVHTVTIVNSIPIRSTSDYTQIPGATVLGKQVVVVGIIHASSPTQGITCVTWLLVDTTLPPNEGLTSAARTNPQVIIGANSISPADLATLPDVPADQIPSTATPLCVQLTGT